MTIPYAEATSGLKAREDITKVLRHFGCESVGFMDNFEKKSVVLAFKHRGRAIQLEASAAGWAAAWLRENPWSSRRRSSRQKWDDRALNQGMIAINSILRDWVKGQITAVETGILSFEAIFLPYMLGHDGLPLLEHILAAKMLPLPENGEDG